MAEILDGSARPSAVNNSHSFVTLAQVYKQLNAPFGAFAMATLRASTKALASNAPGDATYKSIEKQIRFLTGQRDALAAEMKQLLNGAEFDGKTFGNAKAFPLILRGFVLLNLANGLPH